MSHTVREKKKMLARVRRIRGQIEAIERQVRGPVETLLLPDCGHAPHRDHPNIVLSAMSAFAKDALV